MGFKAIHLGHPRRANRRRIRAGSIMSAGFEMKVNKRDRFRETRLDLISRSSDIEPIYHTISLFRRFCLVQSCNFYALQSRLSYSFNGLHGYVHALLYDTRRQYKYIYISMYTVVVLLLGRTRNWWIRIMQEKVLLRYKSDRRLTWTCPVAASSLIFSCSSFPFFSFWQSAGIQLLWHEFFPEIRELPRSVFFWTDDDRSNIACEFSIGQSVNNDITKPA